jgi:DNA-binding SARP family transcriptional activator/predicted ATPase
MLVLNANRVTAVDKLIEAVWDSSPPATARAQIQICVSALRKLLAENGKPVRIVTSPPGYRLEIGNDRLDSERFNSLTDEARRRESAGESTEALALLREALGLWRGPILGDVSSPMIHRLSVGLSERRVTAELSRFRIECALGRTAEIVPDLYALVADHPLREEGYAYLMLALYRSGRQTEALEVYRRARAVLVEQVGLEPADELRELERAILNRDESLRLRQPSMDAASVAMGWGSPRGPVPNQLPSWTGASAVRTRLVRDITHLLTSRIGLGPGTGPVVAISGRGGVGKSTLAVQAAHEVVQCFPDGQLYVDLADMPGEEPSGVLQKFLRALGVAASDVPEGLNERAQLYRSMLSGKRTLLLLDGVSSEEQVIPLLTGTSTCAMLVSSRARLTGLSGNFIHVPELDRAQSWQFLNHLIGEERLRAEPDAVEALIGRCEGLPLALHIAVARLNAKPHWTIAHFMTRLADEERMLDELSHGALEMRSSIALGYPALSSRGQRLFRLLSLIDTSEFSTWAAAALLDSDLATAEDALEELVDAHFVVVADTIGTIPSRYRFHELARAYAREKVDAAESPEDCEQAVGRWLGAWLVRVEHVHRTQYGGDYTILHGTASRWRSPGPRSGLEGVGLAELDHERQSLVKAIRQAAAAGLDELVWDLMLCSITLFEAKGYFGDWRHTAMLARDAVERAGNRRGRAAVHYALGALQLAKKHSVEAEKEFEVALDLFDEEHDDHGRGLVLRNLAFLDRLRGDGKGMLAKYNEALTIMRAVGDRMAEAHILCNVAKHYVAEGDEPYARRLLNEALAISTAARCQRGQAQALNVLADLRISAGDHAEADAILKKALRIVREVGDLTGEAHVMYGISVARQAQGRTEHAELALKHALSRAREVGERQVEAQTLYRLAELRLSRGEVAAARTYCTEALALCAALGAGVWQARMLVLSAEINLADGAAEPAYADLDAALHRLGDQTSEEAEVVRMRAARNLAMLPPTSLPEGSAATGWPPPFALIDDDGAEVESPPSGIVGRSGRPMR